MSSKNFPYVNDFWNESRAVKFTGRDRLIFSSNKLDGDWCITNLGGGNRSCRIPKKDPLTGEQIEMLQVNSAGNARHDWREAFLH
jgi:rhamnose utilization protein RhaD (predicted bifunctional aldolase and dehydrogenase)